MDSLDDALKTITNFKTKRSEAILKIQELKANLQTMTDSLDFFEKEYQIYLKSIEYVKIQNLLKDRINRDLNSKNLLKNGIMLAENMKNGMVWTWVQVVACDEKINPDSSYTLLVSYLLHDKIETCSVFKFEKFDRVKINFSPYSEDFEMMVRTIFPDCLHNFILPPNCVVNDDAHVKEDADNSDVSDDSPVNEDTDNSAKDAHVKADAHVNENCHENAHFFDLFKYEDLGCNFPFYSTGCIEYLSCVLLKDFNDFKAGTQIESIIIDFNKNELVMQGHNDEYDDCDERDGCDGECNEGYFVLGVFSIKISMNTNEVSNVRNANEVSDVSNVSDSNESYESNDDAGGGELNDEQCDELISDAGGGELDGEQGELDGDFVSI